MNALVYMRRWPRLLESAPYCGRDDCARLAKACAVDMPEHISDMLVERISKVVVLLLISSSSRQSRAPASTAERDAGL